MQRSVLTKYSKYFYLHRLSLDLKELACKAVLPCLHALDEVVDLDNGDETLLGNAAPL